MKAAVLKQLGAPPVYDDFKNPEPAEDEVTMHVQAAALKNIDKLLAGGNHYASYEQVPVVVGMDGAGLLDDGTRVYAKGKTGTFAEEALIAADGYTVVPENLGWGLAAAIPNAAMGSYLPLKAKGELQNGDTALLVGATGVTGRFAIQLAKHYGAETVIVLGHINGKEDGLKKRGADILVSSRQEDQAVVEILQKLNKEHAIKVVVDYLWSRPTELVIESLNPGGGVAPDHATKIISVGSLAGDDLKLSSNSLRSGRTQILGAGLGSYTPEQFGNFNQNVLPEMFQLAADGKLTIDLQNESLQNIEAAWTADANERRIVVNI